VPEEQSGEVGIPAQPVLEGSEVGHGPQWTAGGGRAPE
jgi:hypothetical protein